MRGTTTGALSSARVPGDWAQYYVIIEDCQLSFLVGSIKLRGGPPIQSPPSTKNPDGHASVAEALGHNRRALVRILRLRALDAQGSAPSRPLQSILTVPKADFGRRLSSRKISYSVSNPEEFRRRL